MWLWLFTERSGIVGTPKKRKSDNKTLPACCCFTRCLMGVLTTPPPPPPPPPTTTTTPPSSSLSYPHGYRLTTTSTTADHPVHHTQRVVPFSLPLASSLRSSCSDLMGSFLSTEMEAANKETHATTRRRRKRRTKRGYIRRSLSPPHHPSILPSPR